MNKNFRNVLASLLATAVVLAPVAGIAQDKPKAPPANDADGKPSPGARALPFRGTVALVDKGAKTVKVGERVFHVTSETKLMKGDQPATLAEINVGDTITGNYVKGDDGKLTAKRMSFGPKQSPAARPAKPEKPAQKQTPAQPEKQ